jgi:hypothetical protein
VYDKQWHMLLYRFRIVSSSGKQVTSNIIITQPKPHTSITTLSYHYVLQSFSSLCPKTKLQFEVVHVELGRDDPASAVHMQLWRIGILSQ